MKPMLWFDDRREVALAAKIERGAAHYRDRHGRRPTRCVIHPSMMLAAGGFPDVPGIQIGTAKRVEPFFFEYAFGAPEPEPQEAA